MFLGLTYKYNGQDCKVVNNHNCCLFYSPLPIPLFHNEYLPGLKWEGKGKLNPQKKDRGEVAGEEFASGFLIVAHSMNQYNY